MRVLVTGGAGFIGSHICDELLKNGHYVLVIDNLSTGFLDNIKHNMENENFSFEHLLSSGKRVCNFQTWLRHLRTARKIMGTQKNTPRHGRGGSGSVVNSSDI